MPHRFDEIELQKVRDPAIEKLDVPRGIASASCWRRLLTGLTDLSLFLALALAMTPFVNHRADLGSTLRSGWPVVTSLAGFLLVFSYYYFVGSWLIWGKTIGGAIFDVRVVTDLGSHLDVRGASVRWAMTIVSILLGGLGFLVALLPGGLSLPDRVSRSRTVNAF